MNQNRIIIYTDGSCDTQHAVGAWAAILLVHGIKIVLHGEAENTTHNRMELMAVIEAIEYVDKQYPNADLEIYTDSQYVVRLPIRMNKLSEKDFHTKKGTLLQNHDLVEHVIHLIVSHSIVFTKVKAHQKADRESLPHQENYNREVDKLARHLVRQRVNSIYRDEN